jgi:hypothetical protein
MASVNFGTRNRKLLVWGVTETSEEMGKKPTDLLDTEVLSPPHINTSFCNKQPSIYVATGKACEEA